MDAAWVAAIGTILQFLAVVVTAWIAWAQLGKMNENLTASNLMTSFEIEIELSRRKEKLAEVRHEIELKAQEFEKLDREAKKAKKKEIEADNGYKEELLENYLNIFDRLCFYIIHKKLSDDDFRTEYRDMLSDVIKDYKEQFGADTRYNNMVKLHKRWQKK